jgi:glycosyltransferase involved in cell wall biosynthesis
MTKSFMSVRDGTPHLKNVSPAVSKGRKKMPKINVLIPTYNRDIFLDICLHSLTRQTFKDFDVCIYDDGSTDKTAEVVNRYQNQLNIRFIKGKENNGVGNARNQLLEMVNGDYFVWQDSDDLATPDRFEKLIAGIGDKDGCFSYGYFFKSPNTNTRFLYTIDVSKYKNRESLYNNMLFASGIFKSSLATYKFDKRLKKREDVAWLAKMLKDGIKFGCVTEPLYYVRRHDERLTTQK